MRHALLLLLMACTPPPPGRVAEHSRIAGCRAFCAPEKVALVHYDQVSWTCACEAEPEAAE